MIIRSTLAAAAVAVTATAAQAEQWLCVETQVTGFAFNRDGTWQPSDFEPAGPWVFSEATPPFGMLASMMISEVGNEDEGHEFLCEDAAIGWQNCQRGYERIIIDEETMRFVRSSGRGYVNEQEFFLSDGLGREFNPQVALGECTPF